MVDRDLANHDADLAAKVQVIPGLDARLANIDSRKGVDEYHVLQGLKDKSAEQNPKCCYLYQRSGSTGTRGHIVVKGPMEQPKVAQALAGVFQQKTGSEWGQVKPGDRGKPGMFYLQQQSTPDQRARWQYYVSDGVDGKAPGWYPYEASASDEVEELYAQHVANKRESRTASRVVSSGYFKYEVDLAKMKQTNQRTKKVRTIRRAVGDDAKLQRGASSKALKVATATKLKATRSMKGAMKVMKKAMKKPMKKAMKKKKPMKKVMKKRMKKVMKASKLGNKLQVMSGAKEKTKSGHKKSDLTRSKTTCKVVTKKKSAAGKKYFGNIAGWVAACKAARSELGLTGFVAIKKGTEFYKKAKELQASGTAPLLRKASSKMLEVAPPLRKASTKSLA